MKNRHPKLNSGQITLTSSSMLPVRFGSIITTILLFVTLAPSRLFAQVPVISYTSPQTYTVGTAIPILVPTHSGVGTGGYVSTTLASGFNSLTGIAVGATDTVYAADAATGTVWKVPPGGSMVSIATGLNGPIGVAVDATGNVYVAEQSNNDIKKIPVGGGTPVTVASGFNSPEGLAFDASGNLYIADLQNDAIKEMIGAMGTPVTVVSGIRPYAIALDAAGNIYFSNNFTIDEIPAGTTNVIDVSGSGPIRNGTNYLAVDGQGTIYATSGNALYKIPVGGIATTIGSGFDLPTGVAVDASGNVFLCDAFHKVIKKVNPTGGYFISPTLPQGLTINLDDGIISGTALVASPSTNYTVTAYNASGGGSTTVNITVNNPAAPTISYTSPHTYHLNTPITPLSPTSSGVAAPGYSSPIVINSTFGNPELITVDGAGNVFVASAQSGVVKIPAGGGGSTTILNSADADIAADAAGDLFVIPFNTSSVLKFPAGSSTSVTVGTIPAGDHSLGITADNAGNAYVSLEISKSVIKYPSGGGGPVTVASGFSFPGGLAVDPAGNIYVADVFAIKKIAANGGAVTSIGSFVNNAYSFAVDGEGNIYVLQRDNNTLTEIPADGSAQVTIGSGFAGPTGVASDLFGNIYVADQENAEVKLVKRIGGYYISAVPAGLSFNSTTGVISGTPTVITPAKTYTIAAYNAGSGATATVTIQIDQMAPVINYGGPWAYLPGTPITPLSPATTFVTPPGYSFTAVHVGSGFTEPTGVAIDATGNAFVADWGNHAVKKVLPGGGTSVFGSGVTQPYGIAVNAAGDVFVADYGSNSVKKIPAAGGSAVVVGTGFMHPMGLAVDAAGNVYVADYGNNAVKKITAGSGTIVTLGSGFNLPTGVAVDNLGNVYVADFGNNAVKMIPAGGGAVVTLGTFTGPRDIIFDGGGNMYVTEYTTNDLKEIQAGGTSVVLTSHYNHPLGLAIGGAGNLYVADFSNNVIDEYNPTGGFFITPFLPAGLTFSSITGTISGTPTTSGPSVNYTVTAYNSAGSGTGNVTIEIVNNTLSNLTISNGTLTPAFTAHTVGYSATVGTSVSSVTLTPTTADPGATVTVNGTAVTSGTASAPVPLSTGPNPIPVVVTPSGSTATKTYTVTVGYGATNANLSALTLSAGTLSPAFASGTTSYTTTVANAITSITLTPTVSDPNATIKVNGAAVASGTASSSIPLAAGPNTITTLVTAQDGVTTNTYTIVVTRTPSSNAGLANIKTSPTSSLVLTSGPGFLNFNSTVPNSFSSIQVIATAKDATATLTVNGQPVASGSPSQVIPLNVGSNTLTTVITAQDGITTETIIINCTRAAPPSNNSLYEPISVAAPPETVTIAGDGLIVHQAVSPNGDGVNDVFTIDGLTSYHHNKITIIDRNGILVYQAKGYDNSSTAFDGHSNVNGKMQAPGTYFYSLDYMVGGVTKHQTGYIILKY